MGPEKDEVLKIDSLKDLIMITIADGNKSEAQGVDTVRVQLNTGEVIRIKETLWVSGLGRRLLSILAF